MSLDDMTKTILYVEECENTLINTLLYRKDFRLILLRFQQNMDFSKEHLEKSKHCPVFILDKKGDLDNECERFLSFLDELGCEVDFFYNDSEYNQEFVQSFARKLNFQGALTEKQALIVRDKISMKDFIRDVGYHCAEYTLLKSKEEAIMFAEHVGYPMIIKWRRGVSSIEVYKILSKEELDSLDIDYAKERYMAEAYCPWKIWCLDSIVSDGVVVNNLYTWLPFTNLDFAEHKKQFAQIACGVHPKSWKFSPEKLTSEIVSALGMQRGFLHLEAFVDEEGNPIICEFAWRTPGEHMLLNYSKVYDVSIPDLLGDVLLGKQIPKLDGNENIVADVFLPTKRGTVSFITSIEELRSSVNVIDGEVFYNPGQIIEPKRKYTDCSGWVQIKTNSMQEMLNSIQKVYEQFVLEVE